MGFLILHKRKDGNFVLRAHTVQKYIDSYNSYIQIYIDTSKSLDSKAGAGFYVPEFDVRVGKRTEGKVSVDSGEMAALVLALQWVMTQV